MQDRATAVLIGGLLIMAGCGGGDSPTTQRAADSTLAASHTAPPSTAPPTTEAATTTVAPTTTEAATTTVAPTTTLVTATVEGLFIALPGPLDLPPGWVSAGGMPSIAFAPAEGDGVGQCGGPNGDMRAANNGVLMYAAAPGVTAPDGAIFNVWIYAFSSDEAAKATIDATYAQTGCGAREYELHEGSDVGQYDGFGGTAGAKAVWTVRDQLAVGNPGVAEAPGAIFTNDGVEYITRSGGIDYGSRDTALAIWEQHGRFVLVSSLYGSCCAYGYSNTDAVVETTPTLEALNGVMASIRPIVLGRLGDLGLLAA